jgi:membrane-associated protein
VQDQLLDLMGRFSYPAVFALLVGSGMGLPVSEDLVLLTAGIVCSAGRGLVLFMAPVAWLGVVTGDTLLFRIGARLGPKVIEHKRLKAVLTPSRVAWVRARFDRFGTWTIFAVCFLPGLRLPTFVLAGGFGVTQKKFWLADLPAVAIYAPLLVWLGATFGEAALPYVRSFGGWALLGVAVVIGFAVLVGRLRRAR